ncbi:MAG TPA: CPBP family intramembrane glutamic endopeptidase [Actinomycetota bacterium]|nr:CPBP family intramembrane glutamic endopeptidase [Actinomycetota bacterium]
MRVGAGPVGPPRDPALASALAAALAGFALVFGGARERFWPRMTRLALGLGAVALLAEPDLRSLRAGPPQAAAGLGSAGLLYGVFVAGDRLARRVLPRGAEEVDALYALSDLEPPGRLAARLALVIAPAEELFWRGLVQGRLAKRFGRWAGAALAAVAYGLAHLPGRNLTLVGAATTAGAFWSALRALGASMGTLVVSHAVWDVVIFLVAPTARGRTRAGGP